MNNIADSETPTRQHQWPELPQNPCRKGSTKSAAMVAWFAFLSCAIVADAFAFHPHQSSRPVRLTGLCDATSVKASGTNGGSMYTLDSQEIRGPITPIGNNILVKVKDTLTATAGGILLPDQSKQRPTEGLVMAAGPGKLHPFTGIRIDNPIKPGMSVLYGKYDGRPLEYNGDECQMIKDDNVLLCYDGVQMKLDNVVPVRDYVLLELDDDRGSNPLQTSSGVVIANQVVRDDVICEGRVVKVGEGRMASKGDLTPSPVVVGDKVKWKDYAGNDVMIEGKAYSAVKMVDILCTMLDGDEKEMEAAAA